MLRQCWKRERVPKGRGRGCNEVAHSGDRPSKRLIRERAIGGSISREDRGGKVDEHTGIVVADEATTTLLEMGPKAVERNGEAGNVEGVPNKNPLTIKGDDGRTPSKNWEVSIVAHANSQI